MFEHSKKIEGLAEKVLDETGDLPCDGSCTNGFDNDGSTGYEIFENGFSLGKRVGEGSVFCYHTDDTSYFFIGTEEEVAKRLEKYLS